MNEGTHVSQEMCREAIHFLGIEMYWDKGAGFGLGDLARRYDLSCHAVSRAVGGKKGLLDGMERFFGAILAKKLREIADRDLPALDRIHLVLHALVHDQLNGDWYPVGPDVVGELRSGVDALLHRLVLEGIIDGSVAEDCDASDAAAVLVDAIEPFHTWTGGRLSPAMIRKGMIEGRIDEDYRRAEREILPMFERRWVLLHRMLSA